MKNGFCLCLRENWITILSMYETKGRPICIAGYYLYQMCLTCLIGEINPQYSINLNLYYIEFLNRYLYEVGQPFELTTLDDEFV